MVNNRDNKWLDKTSDQIVNNVQHLYYNNLHWIPNIGFSNRIGLAISNFGLAISNFGFTDETNVNNIGF